MKGPWDWWDRNAKLAWERGDVRIYTMDGHDYLFVDQVLYASTSELGWYIRNVSMKAKGRCLEIGLGLGVASKAILHNPKVKHLLTVEQNEDVIGAFGTPLPQHHILLADVNEWLAGLPKDRPMFDFIFVDHYTMDDEDLVEGLPNIQKELEPLLTSGGEMIFWVDENAPDEDQDIVRNLWMKK